MLRGEPARIGAPYAVGERVADGEAAALGLLLSGVTAPGRAGETAAWRKRGDIDSSTGVDPIALA